MFKYMFTWANNLTNNNTMRVTQCFVCCIDILSRNFDTVELDCLKEFVTN